MSQFKPGDIIRYNHGCTALAQLSTPHAGGWHADQCMGGKIYISDNGQLRHADEEDLRMWNKQAWHRGCGIPPMWRPKILKQGGFYIVTFSNHVPQRWRPDFNGLLEKALNYVERRNAEEAG
jgi:hypothetical protein